MINLIAAYGGGRVIGNQGDLPWGRSMEADMRRFRSLTTGHAIIMGRLTFESIGRPLPNRRNIVISRRLGSLAGCEIAPDLETSIAMAAETDDDPFIIGGASVYEAAATKAGRMYLTEIDAHFDGEAFFPEFDPEDWAVTEDVSFPADSANAHPYRFVTYERIR